MDLAIEILCNDQTKRSGTVQGIKELNSQSLATQAKKGGQLVSMMPDLKKAFNLSGDDMVELSAENDALTNKVGSNDENLLEESKTKLLKQIDDKKRASLIISKVKKQMVEQ